MTGRKKKFEEESTIECFRVPKSQRKEYREYLQKKIEKEFDKESKDKKELK